MSGGRWSTVMRLRGLLRKEVLQIRRDPSSILLALVMPVVLLLLFGYGVSLDPEQVPIAVWVEQDGALQRDLVASFVGSRYFEVASCRAMPEAEALLVAGKVDGIIHLRGQFERDANSSVGPELQLIINGVDSNRANLIRGYAEAALGNWQQIRGARGETTIPPAIRIDARVWFNPNNDSRQFLVPGLIALIMTLIGTLLTALVIAREWERGTMEALLTTPLRTVEVVIGKVLPYYGLGILGLITAVAGAVFLFDVHLVGSFWVLFVCSSLFMLASLGLGLALSATFKSQFVAAQVSVLAGFLPAFFLSGLLFDLDSTPRAIQVFSHVVPARYFVVISKTLFLAGDVWAVIWPNAAALAVAATIFLSVAYNRLNKGME